MSSKTPNTPINDTVETANTNGNLKYNLAVDPHLKSETGNATAPPVNISPMEALLRKRSVSSTGFVPMYRDAAVIPALPFPVPDQTPENYVLTNKPILLRTLGDNYLACCHFWSPVNREKSLFVLGNYHRPKICSYLGIADDEQAIQKLKALFCLENDADKDYICTTNFIPAYILAGTAFLLRDEYPLHHRLYVCAMGCDPVYHLQARFIISLTPAEVHYPTPGALARITSQAELRNPLQRIQGAIHYLNKRTINPRSRSIKRPVIDDDALRRQFVEGLWNRCVELEAMDVNAIDWEAQDPEDED